MLGSRLLLLVALGNGEGILENALGSGREVAVAEY